nr:hypothetical protein [uncultured Halomonas sp.]
MSTHPHELPVASPRKGNWQLLEDCKEQPGNSLCNPEATNPLKAAAIKRLEKLKSNSLCNPEATNTANPMQLSRPEMAKKVARRSPLEKTSQRDVENMLSALKEAGHNLAEVEPAARMALLKLSRIAAAEMTAVLDDLCRTAPTPETARIQCYRALSDPSALATAKAVWPDLATLQ